MYCLKISNLMIVLDAWMAYIIEVLSMQTSSVSTSHIPVTDTQTYKHTDTQSTTSDAAS